VLGDFLPPSTPCAEEPVCWREHAGLLAPYLADLDVVVVNLESPLAVGALPPQPKLSIGANLSAHAAAADYVAALGQVVVGLANNHIYDYGPEGVERTRAALSERGLLAIGAGATLASPADVAIVDVPGGLRAGFWAAANNTVTPASASRAGVEPATLKRGRDALARLELEGAHVRIALIHAGLEHTNRPDPADVELLDGLGRAGFDVVGASHSHRIAGYAAAPSATATAGLRFYGLGSVSSGVVYSPLEREGLLVVVGLAEDGTVAEVSARVVQLDEHGWGRVPPEPARIMIEERFRALSNEIADGSYARAFYSDAAPGLLRHQLRDVRTAFEQGGVRGVLLKFRRMRPRHVRRFLHGLVRAVLGPRG
jgi:hypothetical protein